MKKIFSPRCTLEYTCVLKICFTSNLIEIPSQIICIMINKKKCLTPTRGDQHFNGRDFPQIVASNQTKFFVRNKSDSTEILFSWATSCVSHCIPIGQFLGDHKGSPLQEIDLLGRAATAAATNASRYFLLFIFSSPFKYTEFTRKNGNIQHFFCT